MKTLICLFFGSIGFIILISIIWRFFSRRSTLPCPSWLSWMVELNNPFIKVNRASFIIEYLNLKPEMKVLDAGCGPGRLTIPLAKKLGTHGEVTALDIQQEMLSKVQKKVHAKNLHNIKFLQAGLGDGKLEHNQYDRALLVTVLGEIPNQEKALKEIFNSLKAGGILSVTEIIFDPHFQSQKKVLQLATAIGFKKKNVFGNRIAFTMHLEKPQ